MSDVILEDFYMFVSLIWKDKLQDNYSIFMIFKWIIPKLSVSSNKKTAEGSVLKGLSTCNGTCNVFTVLRLFTEACIKRSPLLWEIKHNRDYWLFSDFQRFEEILSVVPWTPQFPYLTYLSIDEHHPELKSLTRWDKTNKSTADW